MTLAEAREGAFENRRLVRRGGDPLVAKHKPNVPTFREAVEQTIEANRPQWRTDQAERDWRQSMENRVFPVIGDMRVDRIRREDVLRVLMPIWADRPEVVRPGRSARRFRTEVIEAVANGAEVSRATAGRAVETMLDVVAGRLADGESVTIAGFGTFQVRERQARTGRNPQTGETIDIAASRAPAFKAGKVLRDRLN